MAAPSLPRAAAFLSLVLLLLSGAAHVAAAGPAAAQQWTLSNGFKVSMGADGALAVHSPKGALLWSTAAQQPYVTLTAVDLGIAGQDGMFDVSQKDGCAAADASVTSAAALPKGQGVVVQGSLGACRPAAASAAAAAAGGNVSFTLTLATTPLSDNQLQLSLAVDPAGACASAPAGGEKTCRLALRSAVAAADGVHGFGEQYSVWDMRGRVVPLLVSEQGVGRGLEPLSSELDVVAHGEAGNWHTTYASLPHYMTDGMQSMLFNHSRYGEFDLTTPGVIEARVRWRGWGGGGGRGYGG